MKWDPLSRFTKLGVRAIRSASYWLGITFLCSSLLVPHLGISQTPKLLTFFLSFISGSLPISMPSMKLGNSKLIKIIRLKG